MGVEATRLHRRVAGRGAECWRGGGVWTCKRAAAQQNGHVEVWGRPEGRGFPRLGPGALGVAGGVKVL